MESIDMQLHDCTGKNSACMCARIIREIKESISLVMTFVHCNVYSAISTKQASQNNSLT